jgi:hypothetical protein
VPKGKKPPAEKE